MAALSSSSGRTTRRIPLAAVDAAVAAKLGPGRVAGNAQPAVFSRQVAMYLAKQVGGWSTTQIGKYYNGRDHSTVCYAVQRIEALREMNPDVDGLVTALTEEIRSLESAKRERNIRLVAPPEKDTDPVVGEELLEKLAERIAARIVSKLALTPVHQRTASIPEVR